MKWLKYSFIGLTALIVLGVLSVVLGLGWASNDLPSMDALKNYQPLLVTRVYTDKDEVFAEFSTERRITIKSEDVPKVLVDAFLAAEDDEFFSHRGVNPLTILRAALKNVQAGHKVQGGSTITMQVAKQILLTPEKSFSRKFKEILLSFKMEKALTKQEILTLYLNQINLGHGAYGVESASQVYFGKHAKDITLAEAAILAALPQAPSRDNPVKNPKASKMRQRYVLGRMLAINAISKEDYKAALVAPVQIKNKATILDSPAPYFAEHVRRYLMQKYGADMVYGGGLKVFTTMNLEAQLSAQDAMRSGLLAIDKRMGLRKSAKTFKTAPERETFLRDQHKGLVREFYDYHLLSAEGSLDAPLSKDELTPMDAAKTYPALVLDKDRKTKSILVGIGNRRGYVRAPDYQWALLANPEEIYGDKVVRSPMEQLNIGDVITVAPKTMAKVLGEKDEYVLSQQPMVQGALISYAIPDGAMKAMVGGYDYTVTRSEFNRAIQAKRQAGSAFKPVVYAAALDNGLTASTILVDSPIIYKDTDEKTGFEKVWKPDNSTDKFYGDTTLRMSLAFSRNLPTIKLLQYLKIPTVVEYTKKMGIDSKLNEDLTLAIGSSVVTVDELTRAIGVFANQGRKLESYFIRRIENRDGEILEEYKLPEPKEVISDGTAFIMTSMMKSVVDVGTAMSVKALGRTVAGKTGTTNDFKDAWFIGYVPQMITGVWVGFDEDRTLGRNETGGIAAAPIWLEYMQKSTAELPKEEFVMPKSVIQVQVDSETGDLPGPRTKKRYVEYYIDGTAPGQNPKNSSVDAIKNLAANLAGKDGVNRTKVITGNSDRASDDASDKAPDSSGGSDDIYRNDL